MNTKLSEMNIKKNGRNKIFKHLTKDDNRYATILKDAGVEKLAVKLHEPHKAPIVIQTETGYRDTTFINRETKFFKESSKHKGLV